MLNVENSLQIMLKEEMFYPFIGHGHHYVINKIKRNDYKSKSKRFRKILKKLKVVKISYTVKLLNNYARY